MVQSLKHVMDEMEKKMKVVRARLPNRSQMIVISMKMSIIHIKSKKRLKRKAMKRYQQL